MKPEELKKLTELQDDALDKYNDKKISLQEMKNILRWANGMMAKYKDSENLELP